MIGSGVEPVIGGVVVGLKASAIATLAFGGWSALRPGRSIALYQAIMRAFNWRVEPINQPREIMTTRWFGIIVVALSLLSLWLLGCIGGK